VGRKRDIRGEYMVLVGEVGVKGLGVDVRITFKWLFKK